MKFSGTDTYVATEDLMVAVNAAIRLERPLLVKGEPGTGKTMLAEEISKALKTGGRIVFVEYRKEDSSVPIKLVHKMTEAQVKKEIRLGLKAIVGAVVDNRRQIWCGTENASKVIPLCSG